MQEVSQKWLDNQERRTTYKSYVKITLYDRNGNKIETFENADIISFTMEEEVDYLNDNLPKYEINFTLDNHTGRFDVDYPPADDNLYSKLNARNKVVVEIGYQVSEDATDIEWIKGGTYYLSEWKISNNSLTAEFTAREWLYFITNECNNNFIDTYSISSAIGFVLSSSGKIKGFSDLSYSDYVVLDSVLDDYKTQGDANGSATNSVVQLLATAGGCTMYFDRENRLHIENIDLEQDAQNYEINDFCSFEYPDITFDELLREVYIDWSWSETSPSDLSTLKNNTDYQVLSKTHKTPYGIPFSETTGEYLWLMPLTFVFTAKGNIPKLTTNQANNYLIESTTFEIGGYTYQHYYIDGFSVNGDVATFTITCENNSRTFDTNATLSLYLPYYVSYDTSSNMTILDGEDGVSEQIINNFVNNDDTADIVLFQTANYKCNRRIIECDFRADPRLDAMDIINIYKKYGGVEKAIVERIKYTWNGGMFNGELRARNIENKLDVKTTIELEGITNGATYEYGTELNVYVYVCTYVNGILYSKRPIDTSDTITYSNTGVSRTSHIADGYITYTIGSSSTYYETGNIYVKVNGIQSDTYNFTIKYHEETKIELDGISQTIYDYGDSINVYVYIRVYEKGTSLIISERLINSSDSLTCYYSACSGVSHKADGYVTLTFNPSTKLESGYFYVSVNGIQSDTYNFTIKYTALETYIEEEGFDNGATYDYGTKITMYVYICTYYKGGFTERVLVSSSDTWSMQHDGLSDVNMDKSNGCITFTIGTETQHTSASFDLTVNLMTISCSCKINYTETTVIELEGITQNANYYYDTQITIYVYISTYVNGTLIERRLINSSDSISFYSTGITYSYKNYQSSGYFIMTVGGAHTAYGTTGGIYVNVNGTKSSTYSYHITYNTFKNASWAEINVVCSGGVASSQYSLGDSKTINGNTAYIVAFDHYYLSSDTSKTASICIGMNVPTSTSHYYYNGVTTSSVYWSSCSLRTEMTDIYNTLDSDLQDIIQKVTVYCASGTSSSDVINISDNLFVPSVVEIYGSSNLSKSGVANLSTYDSVYNAEGYQLEAFEKLNLSSTSDTSVSKYILNTTVWLRTMYLNYTSSGNHYAFCVSYDKLMVQILTTVSSLFVLFNVGVAS